MATTYVGTGTAGYKPYEMRVAGPEGEQEEEEDSLNSSDSDWDDDAVSADAGNTEAGKVLVNTDSVVINMDFEPVIAAPTSTRGRKTSTGSVFLAWA